MNRKRKMIVRVEAMLDQELAEIRDMKDKLTDRQFSEWMVGKSCLRLATFSAMFGDEHELTLREEETFDRLMRQAGGF